MKLPLATKSGEGRSTPLNPEKLVNMYAEVAPESSRSPVVLRGAPGVSVFAAGIQTEIVSQFCTIYMTRFANGTNADISPNNTPTTEFGTGDHDYSSGYYDINVADDVADYFEVNMAPFYTLGEDYVIEAIVEPTSNFCWSIIPFLAFTANGDNKEFGWTCLPGDLDRVLTWDSITSGTQWTDDGRTTGSVHVALQMEHISTTTYEFRVYVDGTEEFSEQTDGDPITLAKIGQYTTNGSVDGPAVYKIHEVAIRCENKYTGNFTAPTTLDDP